MKGVTLTMGKLEPIYVKKQYGSVKLKLKDVMDERGITRNALSKAVNTRFEVIDKWYNNKVENIDLDILARICYVLECSVADLFEYEI